MIFLVFLKITSTTLYQVMMQCSIVFMPQSEKIAIYLGEDYISSFHINRKNVNTYKNITLPVISVRKTKATSQRVCVAFHVQHMQTL